MELIAHCEACGKPLHEGDDYDFIAEGVVWICRACAEAEETRLREEFGWIGVWQDDPAGEFIPDAKEPTCEHQS